MDENKILEQARVLGRELAGHQCVGAYVGAQQDLRKDQQARQLLDEYQSMAENLQRQQEQGQQPTQEDANRLAQRETALAGNDAIKTWLRAQSNHVALMSRVNRAIDEGLSEALGGPAAAGAPGGQPSPQAGPSAG